MFAFTNDNNETETIESITDENGYFMNQVPGEKDYDLFAYADGYWVEHDAFHLQSGQHQVLEIGIAEMSAASRLYGTVKDFETGESIPYAEVQLNCEEASDWDRIGALGTYRVFSYYPDDCADGVLIVTADGFETSVQSVGNIEFEAGSSFDLDIALVQGNDPDPGMLSGTVYSNIDGSELGGAEIVAIAGAIIEARHRRIPVVLDGFVVAAAAAPLHAYNPLALQHCLAAHRSAEIGHRRLLEYMGLEPLLDLNFRLGEASGGAAVIPLIAMACAAANDVPTFAEFFGSET